MINKAKRDYEVSVWTLQDSFVTVLKPSGLENKGMIQETDFDIKDDGENTFSFRIPMTIYAETYTKDSTVFVPSDDDSKINERDVFGYQLRYRENPIWCNVINGNIIASMRKVKVIFNKKTSAEKVFEFMIVKVTERHEGQEKYCEVECEGLAFNELGKQGYKISLEGYDDIKAAQDEWQINGGTKSTKPIENINFWADKVFKNSNWTYSIEMDWSSYNRTWASNKIYEDEYVSDWVLNSEGNQLTPHGVVEGKEKTRLVEASESNRYNLSQTIAETFGVFCRYEYEYDDNYHIIGRKAVFYNNFLKEKELGIIDFTYEYNTKSLRREMDSADLCTKMFVQQLADGDMPSGYATIMDASANKSMEDYILNFDYLYGIGTITEEQYKAVKEYEASLRPLNLSLIELSNNIAKKEVELYEKKAQLETKKASVAAAEEAVELNSKLRAELTDDDGYIEIKSDNPKTFIIQSKTDSTTKNKIYYLNISNIQGLVGASFKIYKTFNRAQKTVSNEITNFSFEKDSNGNFKNVIFSGDPGVSGSIKSVYAAYKYFPKLYYDNVVKTYSDIAARDGAIVDSLSKKVTDLEGYIEDWKTEQNEKLEEKQNIIDSFERLMGPALREGTWQPEDEYSNNGDFRDDIVDIPTTWSENGTETDFTKFIWDTKEFDEEQRNYYEYGVERDKIYYPCIDITGIIEDYTDEWATKLAFVYDDKFLEKKSDNTFAVISEDNNIRYSVPLYIGSKAILAFVKNNSNQIRLGLILTGLSKLSDNELEYIGTNPNNIAHPRVVLRDPSDTSAKESNPPLLDSNKISWLVTPQQATVSKIKALSSPPVVCYPRIEINSNRVKSPATDIRVYYKNGNTYTERKNYEDYSILSRNDKYYITLKPETILSTKNISSNYKINYTISSAPLAIYLDAIQVLKENAYPKVSYEIELISVNQNFVYDAYNRLGQIAHINDVSLMFENVMGYISELQLNLDKPWEDKVVIKNYKTKFEDLFSSIVAQTEQMKKNAYVIGMASDAFSANGNLSQRMIDNINSRLPVGFERVISPAEAYAQYEPFIRTELKKSWEEAGEVLAAAVSSVNDVNSVVLESAEILSGFTENIAQKMTPTSFIDKNGGRWNQKTNEPGYQFKVGDIWKRNDDNVYIATENSEQLYYNPDEDKVIYPTGMLTSLKGWSLVQDGSLAQIKGASLNIDSKAGIINILAENKLNLSARGSLKLTGENVTITGNRSVKMGGPDVYIYSADSTGNDSNTARGVHIFASRLGDDSAAAAVDISGNGIVMRAANGIKIQSGGGIDIATSDGASTSAIRINKDEGIRMGSTQPLVFYSGTVGASGSGAAVKLTKDSILFGVTNGKTGNAVDITKDYMIFGSSIVDDKGEVKTDDVGGETNTSAAGVKITRKLIQMAVGTTANNGTRSYLSLTGKSIKIANTSQEGSGAQVIISQSGVLIGTADNKTKFTKPISEEDSKKYSGAKFQVYAPNFVVDEDGHLYAYDADIAGKIKTFEGQIGGWIISEHTLHSSSSKGVTGLQAQGSGNWAITVGAQKYDDWSTGAFRVAHDGSMYATKGQVGGWTIGSDFLGSGDSYTKSKVGISSSPDKDLAFWAGWQSGKPTPFYVRQNGELHTISGQIGGWTIGSDFLGSGNSYSNSNTGISASQSYAFWAGWQPGKTIPFYVKQDGELHSIKGQIGGWTINEHTLHSSSGNKVTGLQVQGSGTWAITVGANNYNDWSTGAFRVAHDGSMYAVSGQIGGWTIGSDFLGSGSSYNNSKTGISASKDYAFWAGYNGTTTPFYVRQNGELTATKFYISSLGNLDVGAALTNLLAFQAATTDDEDGASTKNGRGCMVSSWSNGNWIKVTDLDGKVTKIPFGNAARLSDARTAGANSVTASDPIYDLYSGDTYNIYVNLNSKYKTTSQVNAGTIDLSGLHESWYNSGRNSVTSGSGVSITTQALSQTMTRYTMTIKLENGKTITASVTK